MTHRLCTCPHLGTLGGRELDTVLVSWRSPLGLRLHRGVSFEPLRRQHLSIGPFGHMGDDLYGELSQARRPPNLLSGEREQWRSTSDKEPGFTTRKPVVSVALAPCRPQVEAADGSRESLRGWLCKNRSCGVVIAIAPHRQEQGGRAGFDDQLTAGQMPHVGRRPVSLERSERARIHSGKRGNLDVGIIEPRPETMTPAARDSISLGRCTLDWHLHEPESATASKCAEPHMNEAKKSTGSRSRANTRVISREVGRTWMQATSAAPGARWSISQFSWLCFFRCL